MNIVNISCWWAYYLWQNKKRDRAFAESGATLEERDYNNKIAGETDMTDHRGCHIESLTDARKPAFQVHVLGDYRGEGEKRGVGDLRNMV